VVLLRGTVDDERCASLVRSSSSIWCRFAAGTRAVVSPTVECRCCGCAAGAVVILAVALFTLVHGLV